MRSQRRQSIRRFLRALFLSTLTLCLWLGHASTNWQVIGDVVNARSPDANQLVQQGVIRYQAGDVQGAIAQWQTALVTYRKTNNRANEAIVLENLARANQRIGQSDRAIDYWEQVIADYRQLGNLQQVGRMLTELSQSYSSLGQSRKAIAILCGQYIREQPCTTGSALQIARAQKDFQGEAAALGSRGDAYRLRGDYKSAIADLQDSLKIANVIGNPAYQTSALNSLGNAHISLAQVNYRRASSAVLRGESVEADRLKEEGLHSDFEALKHFRASLELASAQNDLQGQMRTLLNAIPPYYRTQAFTSGEAAKQQALSLLEHLPDSRDTVYAAVDLARLLQPVTLSDETYSRTQCLEPELESKAAKLLQQAVSTAKRIQDRRSESFALGELAHVYECRKDLSRALELTQQARLTADRDLLARDSLYLWDWQAGRLYKAQHREADALKAYERAVTTLEGIRSDILVANRDLQFDFRDAIDPVYRELAELRLEQAGLPAITPVERTKGLTDALSTIDSLKLAELQNYFGNDCVLTALNQKSVDLVGAGTATAVFSSIILRDRTAILVSLSNGEKKSAWIDVDSKTLSKEIEEFRRGLERFTDYTYDPTQAKKLYDRIVGPFATDLDRAQIKTLVFIQDGILRSVPMAALHDGKQFLVQKYAIASTPSLSLTDPKTIDRKKLRALVLGLTKDATVNGQEFGALTNVGKEIKEVETRIPGSKELVDENFTSSHLQQELSKTVYPIIHIATHGEFGSEPEDTFLVTGNNGKLTINDLDAAIRSTGSASNSVELLALTACETAAGDDRSALGLAGIALQAGVRSALASLWSVQDESTVELVTQFYRNLLQSDMSKAEALAKAQRTLIDGDYAHPAYWAPFILIGNWL